MRPLLPEGYEVPPPYMDDRFRLEPLGQRHNEEDQLAWTWSIDHIQRTPGFAGRDWPGSLESQEQNFVSVAKHEDDFRRGLGFAYAVFDATTSAYVGCVYFYPPRTPEHDIDVRSWVRFDKADLDKPLYDAMRNWLRDAWPWARPDYAPR